MIGRYRITDQLLDEFRRRLVTEEKSELTIAQYMRDVRDFCGFLQKGEPVDKEEAIAYKDHLVKTYRSSATVNTKLAALNKFFAATGMDGCRVKLLRRQRRMFCETDRELTREEYLRLLETAQKSNKPRLSLIMQTICSTGIRVSELRWITAQAVAANLVEVSAKGKRRRIFLPPKLREALRAYMKRSGIESGPVFATRAGRPLDRSNIWHDMKNLCRSAGVESTKVFPHNLRHLFAKDFYAVDKDVFRLADILGHSSVETTRIYTVTSGYEHERRISSLRLVL